jgi:hypothetical protein
MGKMQAIYNRTDYNYKGFLFRRSNLQECHIKLMFQPLRCFLISDAGEVLLLFSTGKMQALMLNLYAAHKTMSRTTHAKFVYLPFTLYAMGLWLLHYVCIHICLLTFGAMHSDFVQQH